MTKELEELDKKHFIHPSSSIQEQQKSGPKAIWESGQNIYLTDTNGNKFIEAMSSLWNVNIGYGRKELADASSNQMKKLAFSSSFSSFSNEPAILLAEKVASISPQTLNAVFFTSGGSESNDSAIKLARHYWRIQGKPEKRKIIARKRGYHGVSSASTSATGIPEFWDMAGRGNDEFIHAKAPFDITTEEAIQSFIDTIESVGSENIAAFIGEPIMGAGGVIIPEKEYIQQLREICTRYNILYIDDEIICGFGRTGKMFGIEQYDVIPDMITFAKGITSGYIPLGGVIVSDEIHEMLKEKSEGVMMHGFTYSGHPTSTAVGLKNIEIIEKENLVENSRKMGAILFNKLQDLQSNLQYVSNIRSTGLIGALEMVKNPEENERFPADKKVASQVIESLFQKGVICRAVTYENTGIICFCPPLIINEEQLNDLMNRVHEAIKEVEQKINQ